MALFDANIFDPNIFGTTSATSTTETSVVERRKSKGKTGAFFGFDTRKFRKLFQSFESSKSVELRAFAPAAIKATWIIESVRLQDLDAEKLIEDAKAQLLSAASKSVDMKTLKKTMAVTSFKPKRVRLTGTNKELLTAARELIEGAKQLMEKPSLYPGKEPALYGDEPIYFYGEVEFRVDKPRHDEPDECDDYNGQVFSYGPDGLEDGAPNPPLHPNCRCKLIETKTGVSMWFPGSEWADF